MRITVIGAGNTGLAMAAHLSQEGHRVTLWNRSQEAISTLMKTRTIHAQGIIQGDYTVDLVTANMEEALTQPDLVMITTPANAHPYLAETIGRYLKNEPIIILNPGRTFGAIEFQLIFSKFNQRSPIIAETQTSLYTSRKCSEDSVIIYSIKKDVLLSTFDAERNSWIIRQLPDALKRHFVPARSMIETSIGNVGMILHTAPLLLNAGWTENEKYDYHYYHDGITPTISQFIEKVDQERIAVSKKLGLEVESTKDWMKRSYSINGETLYECIQNNHAYRAITAPNTLNHRYIYEDIACGLVPLEAIGKYLGLEMKYTGLVIDLASAILEVDFRKTGRNLEGFWKRKYIKRFFRVGEHHVVNSS